jgi:hypothetical protein
MADAGVYMHKAALHGTAWASAEAAAPILILITRGSTVIVAIEAPYTSLRGTWHS